MMRHRLSDGLSHSAISSLSTCRAVLSRLQGAVEADTQINLELEKLSQLN